VIKQNDTIVIPTLFLSFFGNISRFGSWTILGFPKLVLLFDNILLIKSTIATPDIDKVGATLIEMKDSQATPPNSVPS